MIIPILIVLLFPLAFLGNSLEDIKFIITKNFPSDTNFDKMTQEGLLWLTSNDGKLLLPTPLTVLFAVTEHN